MGALFLVLSVSSIVIMFYALYSVFIFRKRVPGGKVKSTWKILSGLIVMFSAGYLSTPFFSFLPQDIKDVLVGVIFLSGAIFVVIVIKLFFKIVEDIGI